MKRESFSLFSKRPALIALIFYISGIFISAFISISYIFPLILTLALLIALAFAYANRLTLAPSIIMCALLVTLGWYLTRLNSGPFPANHISNLVGAENRVELVGHVIDEPDYRLEKTYLVIECDSVRIEDIWIPSFRRVRASIQWKFPCEHSDRLRLLGYLSEPAGARNPGGFDYKAYLKAKAIFATLSVGDSRNAEVLSRGHSFLSSYISPLRADILNTFNSSLSPQSASLLSGFILGERSTIAPETEDLFRKTGTLHLMAVSGSNVALIIAIFAFPLALLRIPRNIRAIILLAVVVSFAILTRLEPSVIRASIMASVGLIAYGWMRKPDYINLLAFAGFLMLLLHPLEIYDVGLQLSFAAAFGIIFVLPRFGAILGKLSGRFSRYFGYFVTIILSTLAAQIAVMPLMIHYFRNVPALGTLANLPVALLAAIANILGIILLFCNLVSAWLANLISIPLEFILKLTVGCLGFFAALPSANIKTPTLSWNSMILFWLACYFVFILFTSRRFSKRTLIAILIAFNFQLWNHLLKSEPEWRLDFLDLGRNHAWVYSERGGPAIARYDCFIEQDDVDDILIPFILDNCKSKLDYLLTSTPGNPELLKLTKEFRPEKIANSESLNINLRDTLTNWDSTRSNALCNFRAGIKIVWELSDNRHGQVNKNPAVEICIGGGSILLSDWTGAEIVRVHENQHLRLLEMPWSVYAQGKTLDAISLLEPEFLIFSPDQFANRMPYSRSQLTHSRDRILSTSLCGAIALTGSDSSVTLRTMKPIGP